MVKSATYIIFITVSYSLLLCVLPNTAGAQQASELSSVSNVSIRVSGRVIQDLSVQNITIEILADVNLVATEPEQINIEIDPTQIPTTYDNDLPGSGYVVAKGEPGTPFSLSFPRFIELSNVDDGSRLVIEYIVAHNSSNEQSSADFVREVTGDFTLNADGEYHFWFGGRVDITSVSDGEYEGEFFMDVEYKL